MKKFIFPAVIFAGLAIAACSTSKQGQSGTDSTMTDTTNLTDTTRNRADTTVIDSV